MGLIKDTVIVGKDLNIEMGKCARSDRTESSFSVAMDAASIVSQFLYSCRLNVLRISRLNFFACMPLWGKSIFVPPCNIRTYVLEKFDQPTSTL